LVLLLFGGRLVRPALALLGMGLGGLAGWVVGGASHEAVSGVGLAWVVAGVGAIAGWVLGLCLFRPVVALAAALACGAIAGIGAAVWLGALSPGELVDGSGAATTRHRLPTLEEEAGVLLRESLTRRSIEQASLTGRQGDGEGESRIAKAAVGAWERISARAGEQWQRVEPRTRMRILGVTVLGAVAGLIVGGLGPRRVVAVLSAGVGAAVLVALAPDALPMMGIDTSAAGPSTWAGLWALLAVAGATVQLAMIRRREHAGKRPASGVMPAGRCVGHSGCNRACA
jgi:hypothetical protein